MTKIARTIEPCWRNYHRTQERANVATWSFGPPGSPTDPIAALKASAALIGHALGAAEKDATMLQPLGSAWSFSDLLAGSGALLHTALDRHIFKLPPALLGPAAPFPDRMVLAAAGTTVAQLNAALEPRLSLRTSGAHNGQTLGGLLGTGTHGSVIGYGGFQNQVRGIHIVTDLDQSWWIERGPTPWLATQAAAALATHVVLEAALFDAVLVHLGGLGVINAVLIEADAGYLLDIVKVKRILPASAIAQLEAGDFLGFARDTWAPTDEAPYYVEVILDPFAPVESALRSANPALVTLFFKRPAAALPPADAAGAMAPGPTLEAPHEALNLLADAIGNRPEHDLMFPLPQAIAWLVALEYKPEPALGQPPRQSTWGAANGPHKKQNILGFEFELFNAAFAIERAHLQATLRTMLDGFHRNGGGHQVFTLRFVSNAAGLLAFTRFPETVVINLDGARTANSVVAAQNVALALEQAGISFSQHWGKQGVITPNRFKRDFGDPADPTTPAGGWRAARARLLVRPAMRAILRNAALQSWDLA